MKNYKLSIKSKFLIIIGLITFCFLFSIAFIVISIFGALDVEGELKKLVDLERNFVSMEMTEKNFLLTYKEDVDYFATGKNVHFDEFKKLYKQVKEEIKRTKTSEVTQKIVPTNDFSAFEKSFENYQQAFEQLSTKIREHGVGNYGLISKINETFAVLVEKSPNPTVTNYLTKLSQLQNKYSETFAENSYNEFLQVYEDLQVQLTGNVPSKDSTTLINTAKLDSLGTTTTISNQSFAENLKNYHDFFVTVVAIDKEIGTNHDKGLQGTIRTEKQTIKKFFELINNSSLPEIQTVLYKKMIWITIEILLIIIFLSFVVNKISKTFLEPIVALRNFIRTLSKGELPEKMIELHNQDEISEINDAVKDLVTGLRKTTDFAIFIGKNDFDVQFEPLSEKDALGNSLLEMRNSLRFAKEEEQKRKIQDEKQNWATRGITKFNDIIRQNSSNLEELSYEIISNLVDYLKANQGGLFLYNDENKKDPFLEMVAAYAYDRRKFIEKKVLPGEGLIGTCAMEKKTIFLTKIPDNYIKITSGLGKSNPKSLVIVPVKMDETIMGVLEIASFEILEKHEVEFIEKVSETIASALASVRINQRTNYLLEESKLKSEAMAAQEEEMRQNMEELQATQEEMLRKQAEIEEANDKMRANEEILKKAFERAQSTEKELRKKNTDAKEKEDELKRSMDEALKMQADMKAKQVELEKSNLRLQQNETILKKAIEKTTQKENELQQLREDKENFQKQIDILTQKIESLQELAKFKDEEIQRLRKG